MEIKDIEKLAKLARIDLSDTEKKDLLKDIEKILAFVDQIQDVSADIDVSPQPWVLRNVMREDGEPHESGIYTEKLLEAAPARKGTHVRVKNIL